MAKNKTGVALHREAERGANAYFTPPVAIESLISLERNHIPGVLLEPCCGSGNIVLPLRAAGYQVIASDLHDYGCPDSVSGLDFFETNGLHSVPGVVTNPPYSMAESFIIRSLQISPYVAMLLRLNFLESEGRYRRFWPKVPLTRVWVSARRLPMMHREGWTGKKSSSTTAFAWFVFERSYTGEPVIRWFDWRKEISSGKAGSRPQPPGPGEQ